MARIEQRKQAWLAVMDVPRALHPILGKQLVQSLKTRVKAEAQARSRRVFAEMQERIDAARRPPGDAVMGEADQWRESVMAARAGETVVSGPAAGDEDQEAFLQDLIADRREAIAERHGDTRARSFAAVAMGKAMPLQRHIEDWLREGGQKGSYEERTKGGLRRTLGELEGWMTKAKLPPTVEAIDRRQAGRFVSECLVQSGRQPKTVTSIVSACRSYWTFLIRKGLVDGDRNPWDGQAPPKGAFKGTAEEQERAFTDAEVSRLLDGPADEELADLMRVGALSGMRLDEAYRLEVRDCDDGLFNVRRAKTKAGERRVPIHPALSVIVARRVKDKGRTEFLFHEPGPRKAGRERSMAASKRFGYYRKREGVNETAEGKRRGLVNFHSYRRWFITAAIRAGQPERVVQQVVGHKQQGVTMGVYFGGDLADTLRACVEAVNLPLLPSPPKPT